MSNLNVQRENNLQELTPFDLSDIINIDSIKDIDSNKMKSKEYFDYKALEYIVNNIKYYKSITGNDEGIIRNNIVKASWDVICKKYFDNSKRKNKRGEITVKYSKLNGRGRMYASDSLSLQSMFGVIRQTIAHKYYRDIDMKNAHLVIALHICENLDIECPNLKKYVNNREELLQMIIDTGEDMNRDTAKRTVIRTMYGSPYHKQSDIKWLTDFSNEAKMLSKTLQGKYTELVYDLKQVEKINGKNIYSFDGSFLAKIICCVENAILMRTLKFFKDKKIIKNDFALCFDGLMVPKSKLKEDEIESALKELEQTIKTDMGITIKFGEKKMTPLPLQVPYDFEPEESEDEEDEEEDENLKIQVKFLRTPFSDGDIADYFCKRFNNSFIHYDGKTYKYNGTYWEETTSGEIYKYLDKMYFELLDTLNKNFTGSQFTDFYTSSMKKILRLRTTKTLSNVWGSIKFRIEIKDDIFDLNADLLGFQNGVYNLKEGEFREGKLEDYITLTVPYDYKKVDTKKCMNFIDSVLPIKEEKEFFLKMLSSCVRGQTLNNFIILTGSGRNGKDTIITYLLKNTLGKDLYYFGTSNIITDKQKSGANPEIASMNKKRVVIYNEPNQNEYIRCSTVKQLTGGDEINARLCHSNNTETKLNGTHIVLCNKKPLLDCVDDAISNRLYIIPFRALFLKPEKFDDYPKNTPYMREVDTYYQSSEFIDENKLAFMNILLEYYKLLNADKYVLKNAPKSITELGREYLSDSDEFYTWFLSKYEKTERDDDFIQIKHLFTMFKRSEYYNDLSKSRRRKANKKWMVNEIKTNINLKAFHRDRHYYKDETDNKKESRNVILRFKIITEEDENSDNE